MTHSYKTPLLAFALFLTFTGSVCAQGPYQHYFNSTYQWNETVISVIFSGGMPCYLGGLYTQRMSYHVVGIDSVDGYFWYKVHHDWQNETWCDGSTTTIIAPPGGTAGVAFRIREDSTGKIWRRFNSGTIDLMYDFRPGLGLADSLWVYNYTDYIVIDSIDSLNFGAGNRARYWSACTNIDEDIYIVEGIGSSRGLEYVSSFCGPVWDNNFVLQCAKIDNSTLVLNADYPCGVPGHVIVGVDDEMETEVQVRWDRNNERLVLQQMDPLEYQPWAVYDISGRVIRSGDRLAGEIMLPGLSSGIYIFLLQPAPGQNPIVKKFLR
jgi:hypothetical protein